MKKFKLCYFSKTLLKNTITPGSVNNLDDRRCGYNIRFFSETSIHIMKTKTSSLEITQKWNFLKRHSRERLNLYSIYAG